MTTLTEAGVERGKRTKRLSYVLFAAAMVFAGITIWLEEHGIDGTRTASIFAGFLGLSSLAWARSGIASGRIRVRHSIAYRSERPIAFWTAVSLLSVVGFGVASAGVLIFFGVLGN